MPKKLVIDTDGVADDVRAISMALQTPNVEVLALTAVNGCVTVQQACANLARMLRANRRRVPIYKGAECPMILNKYTHLYLDAQHFFGSDGLGNAPNSFPKVQADDFNAFVQGKHAALALCELFDSNPGTTLVCIGPLTNVALALKLNPMFARLPERMIILGGNVYGMGNVQSYSTAESNFNTDPEAAHIVLKEMQCPITLVPWEVFMNSSEQAGINFHAHLELDVPLSQFFATATCIGRARLEENNRQYVYCDEIAVGIAIDDRIVRDSKLLRASVELHGEMTRGQVAVDWTGVLWHQDQGDHPLLCKSREPIEFVLEYDVHRLDQMLKEAIHNSAIVGQHNSSVADGHDSTVVEQHNSSVAGEYNSPLAEANNSSVTVQQNHISNALIADQNNSVDALEHKRLVAGECNSPVAGEHTQRSPG